MINCVLEANYRTVTSLKVLSFVGSVWRYTIQHRMSCVNVWSVMLCYGEAVGQNRVPQNRLLGRGLWDQSYLSVVQQRAVCTARMSFAERTRNGSGDGSQLRIRVGAAIVLVMLSTENCGPRPMNGGAWRQQGRLRKGTHFESKAGRRKGQVWNLNLSGHNVTR